MTTDQRARGLARAHAQRAANRARWAGVLRRDFLDEGHWLRLARQAGVTLPRWDSPPTPARITQFVGKLNRSVPWYLDHAAVRTLNDFRVLNPTWPMRALAGLLLEAHCQQQHLEPAAAPGSLARLDPAHTDTDNARQRKAVRVTGRQQQGPHQQPRRT